MPGQVVDRLPDDDLSKIRNIEQFAGILALDKWTNNSDDRQAVFTRTQRQTRYTAMFIDQGFCFNGKWAFTDALLSGIYSRRLVYEGITGWSSFSPWLDRLENLSPLVLCDAAQAMPPDWYARDGDALNRLIDQLLVRRARIRDWIRAFRFSDKNPFPSWTSH